MLRVSTMLVVTAVATLLAAQAPAAVYMETFDADTGAWRDNGDGPNPAIWSNALGPDGLPGVMDGSRVDGPFPSQMSAHTNDLGNPIQRIDNFLGNINAKYGPLVEFSFWVKDLDGVQGNVYPREIFVHPSPPTMRWYTYPTLMDTAPNGWEKYGTVFDTTWTDAQANAGGWFAGDPGPTFAATMANVFTFNVNAPTNGPVGNNEVLYMDNIFIGNIPEPASLGLLGLGGLLMLRRRR